MESVVCTGFYIKREDSLDGSIVPPPKKVEYLPLAYPGLTPYLKEKAEKELNESEENIKNGLAQLKELIAAEQLSFWTDDDFLMCFLRVKKYDVKRSFQQLKEYSKERYLKRDVFCNEKMIKFSTYLNPKLCGVLPKRDAEGRAIIYFSASEFNGDEDPDLVIGLMQVLCQFALTFPPTQVSGVCFIADTSVPSVESLTLLFRYIKEAFPKTHIFPARFKRIDCVNVNVFFQAAFNIIKNFFPSKILRRVTLHGDQKESLLAIYPPEILPDEFGGTLGTLKDIQPICQKEMLKVLPKFLDSNKYFQSWYDKS